MQNDIGNQNGQTTIIAPFLSGFKSYPFVVNVKPTSVNNLDGDRHVNLSQMRAVDYRRLQKKLGVLEAKYWVSIEEAVSIELGFSDVFL